MFNKINLNNNKTEANDYQMEINIKTLQIISRYTIITIIEYTQLTGFFFLISLDACINCLGPPITHATLKKSKIKKTKAGTYTLSGKSDNKRCMKNDSAR